MKLRTQFRIVQLALAAALAFILVCLLLSVARAQSAPIPAVDPTVDDLLKDLSGHQWAPAVGVAIFLVIGLTKQGWFSTWVATKIPSAAQPWVALILGAIAAGAYQLSTGVTWTKALLMALEAAATAVFAHQAIVEGLFKGNEIVPMSRSLRATKERTAS